MEELSFTDLFPEWILSEALKNCKGDISEFWNAKIIHTIEESYPSNTFSFSDLYPSLSVESLKLVSEKPFQRDEGKQYGIPQPDYEKSFWCLRPDFLIQDEKKSLIVILEAKGGDLPSKTWRDTKERLYYEFLEKCTFSKKGFYFIIPKKFESDCIGCLKEYFKPSESVKTGFLCWEDLLDKLKIIGDEVGKISIDRVIKEMEGLKELRTWQKNRNM